MSLWADYIRELRGPEFRYFLEYSDCFAVISYPAGQWADCIIIHDMYVKPELRKQGRGKTLLEDVCQLGLKAGRKYVCAELEIATQTFEGAFKAQTAVGFMPVSANNGIIVMKKEL